MNENLPQENIVSDLYDGYNETQKEILQIELRKTRNKLFTLAGLIFALDLIVLITLDALQVRFILLTAIVPALFVGLAFLSLREPLVAMIVGSVIIAAFWIYNAIQSGGMSAISGWIVKAVVVYLIIAGFQNAIEAHRIKRELKV